MPILLLCSNRFALGYSIGQYGSGASYHCTSALVVEVNQHTKILSDEETNEKDIPGVHKDDIEDDIRQSQKMDTLSICVVSCVSTFTTQKW